MSYILIVDDEPDVRELLRVQLDLLGYTTKQAKTGQEALDLVRAEKPAAVIMDLAMPEMDGAEACYVMKHSPSLKDIPIILFTAIDHKLIPSVTIAVEADAILHKPIEIEKLTLTLDKLLRS